MATFLRVCLLFKLCMEVTGSVPSNQVEVANRNNTPSLESCCTDLASSLPDRVFFQNQSSYVESIKSYYSGQEADLAPACIARPQIAQEVAAAIEILARAHTIHPGSCKFAIRSGGHTPYAGSANIGTGITLDLQGLNKVVLHEGDGYTSIGPGARWGDVYSKLDAVNLTVVGGRSKFVGVGGLLTGGGISYFSPRYGFACDNIINFEVVIGNGTIINANRTFNSDLATVLRGGSNNFGVVTRFDLLTLPQKRLWGGSILYDFSTLPKQLKAFIDFVSDRNYDEHAAFIQTFGTTMGHYVIINNPVYTKPEANPQVYKRFTSIMPQISNDLGFGSHSDLLADSTATEGLRNAFLTMTWTANLEFLTSRLLPAWQNFSNQTIPVAGLQNALLNQALPRPLLVQSVRRGPNLLNSFPVPNPSQTPVITLLSLTWNSSTDDDFVGSTAETFITTAETAARELGVYLDFKYLNYADRDQDVIKGYGSSNERKIREASKAYDPMGLFQLAVPGGLKIWP